jgi:hypothetical protein
LRHSEISAYFERRAGNDVGGREKGANGEFSATMEIEGASNQLREELMLSRYYDRWRTM